jgi:hypothetical protein
MITPTPPVSYTCIALVLELQAFVFIIHCVVVAEISLIHAMQGTSDVLHYVTKFAKKSTYFKVAIICGQNCCFALRAMQLE